MNINKNKLKIPALLLLAVVIFGSGFFIGLNKQLSSEKLMAFLGKDMPEQASPDFAPFWKVWNSIDQKYPDANKVTNEERIFGAIAGLVESLDDPYSEFFDPEETETFEEEISGNFSGVGMEVGMKEGALTVIAPLKNTPAERAGILAGDKISEIDGESTTGMKLDEAIKMIRGEKGTTVTLTVIHKGSPDPIEVKIMRDTISIPTLDTELRSDGIFVISLYNFSANSTSLFRQAMKEFVASKSSKLILDLRGNPGGYLSAAVDMSSWFLPGGKTVAIEDFGGKKEQKLYRSTGYNIFNDKLQFVILIDEGSASASEIVAGALRDHKRALLVGEKSFGKGSVQEVVRITPDTIFKVTIAKWLTPLGHSISDTGLTPDYIVTGAKEKDGDPQMEKAAEVLKNWPGIK